MVVNTLFFARVQFWSGDWAWGPRYMQIVVPCLAAMAAPLMDSRAWRRALIVVSVLGFFFAALPAVLMRFTLELVRGVRGDATAHAAGPEGLGPQLLRPRVAHAALAANPLRDTDICTRSTTSFFFRPRDEPVRGPFRSRSRRTRPALRVLVATPCDIGWGAVLFFAAVAVAAVVAGFRTLSRALAPEPTTPATPVAPAEA